MSRIGKVSVVKPDNVTLTVDGVMCTVAGPLGTLTQLMPPLIDISQADGHIAVTRADDTQAARAAHGLARTLVQNMVTGTSNGFTKQLEIQGVGYRATMQGANIVLAIGYSHPVNITAPEGISFTVEKNIISVKGINKALVGEVSAKIREVRKPEPYKGKGIRYVGEYVLRKAGKTAKA